MTTALTKRLDWLEARRGKTSDDEMVEVRCPRATAEILAKCQVGLREDISYEALVEEAMQPRLMPRWMAERKPSPEVQAIIDRIAASLGQPLPKIGMATPAGLREGTH